ncbi:MAG: Uma2 family endonuclease [Gemmataceae bacterium]
MSTITTPTTDIVYPESDGLPMADNTRQARWIVVLFDNLSALFRDRPDVFVAANILWYPVEGHPEIRQAPDVLVAFGRPKGDRGSYIQHVEENIPPAVVFEILSPSNTLPEMDKKLLFYEDHGVEEYYVYDPEGNWLQVYVRQGTILRRVWDVANFVSPRLGIRFARTESELTVHRPDGKPFLRFEELEEARNHAEQERTQAEQRAAQAEQRTAQAEQRAVQAEQRTAQAEQRAAQAEQRAARLAALSRKARHGQATPEELQELERLEEERGVSGS